MNQNSDKSEGILVLCLMGMIILFGCIWFIREYIAGFQKILFIIDFKILEYVPILQKAFPDNIMLYQDLLLSERFEKVGYDVLNNEYYNIYDGKQYTTMQKLYKAFFYINSTLLALLLIPTSLIIKKIYSVKKNTFKINKRKEEVYPGLVDNKRRPSKNKIFEVMDYFPPVIGNSEPEYIAGSIRLSKKQLDSAWLDLQKNKLEQIKKELDEYDYLKLTYLDKFYVRNFNDKELLDYIRILVYKGKKPERNTKKPNKQLPKKLTGENRNEIIETLKSNLIEHNENVEYGRLLMPDYYILTPLESKKVDEFECLGSKELISVLKKYVMDDFRNEINKTISELKKENTKLEQKNDSESVETIKQNLNLIIEMENMLNPDFNNSRNQKILNLATVHEFEETFLMGMLIYGRKLVNLPIGVLAKMKFQNATLWYALTSIGRTYQYRSGLPISVLYNIEKEEAAIKEKQKLDIDEINPDDIISDAVKEEINDSIGDQYSGGKAFNTNKPNIRQQTMIKKKEVSKYKNEDYDDDDDDD